MTIYEKLTDIQSKLKAPKGQFNSFGKYNYRNCEDILEAVKPLLKEHGLYISLSDKIVQVAQRIYVEATVSISDGENTIQTTAYAREEESKKGMDSSQITGASSSYARKYALNGLFAIDDTKDSDTTNTGSKSEQKSKSQEQPVHEKEYKCVCCGKPFEAFTAKSNGVTYSALQAYHISEKKFGKPICKSCATKSKEGQQ